MTFHDLSLLFDAAANHRRPCRHIFLKILNGC